LSLSGPPINPTTQSAPGLFWFVTSSCNGSKPPSINPFDHYLKRKRHDKTFYFNPTDYIEIERIITSLKNKRSCGPDGINSQFFKAIKVEVSEGIAIIINKSLATGVVPDFL